MSDEESPVNKIMQAVHLISEALRLLESAMITTTLEMPDDTGKAYKLDFSFLDAKLIDVDWGFDHQKRLRKAFANWNDHEARFVEPELRRTLITVRDLLNIGEDELRAQPYVGRESINRINAVLGKHGMKLNV